MSYEIRIRGQQNVLVVDDHRGGEIKKRWESYCATKHDSVLDVDGWTGRFSDIRNFTRVANNASSTNKVNTIEREYLEQVRKKRAQAAEVRAQSLGFFKFVFFTFTGERANETACKKAVNVQEKFFKENPRRTICAPELFKPLVEKYRIGLEAHEGLRKLPIASAGIRLINGIVAQDVDQAKHAAL